MDVVFSGVRQGLLLLFCAMQNEEEESVDIKETGSASERRAMVSA